MSVKDRLTTRYLSLSMCAISESRLCKKNIRNGMHYGLRAMLAMTLRQKKGELESKSSNKSDIWPSAASKK